MSRLPVAALAVTLSAGVAPAAVTIGLEKRAYKVGDEVRLVVTGARNVVVGSDLKQASFDADATRPVPAGLIRMPGLYQFTATAPGQPPAATLLVVPSAGDPLLFESATFAPAPVDFGKRLRDALTLDNLKEAGGRALRKWAADNAAAVGKSAAVCALCASPVAEVACPVCGGAAGSLAADFLQVFVEELADLLAAKQVLTADQARLFKAALKVGKAVLVVADVTNPARRLEAALDGAKLLTAEIKHDGVRLGLTYLIDETGKVVVLLKLTK